MDPRDQEIQRLRSELAQYVQQRPPLVPQSGRGASSLAQAGSKTIQAGKGDVDRMVLVSRDGRPRVATPSQMQMREKRVMTARSQDLNAVADLPSY